MIRDDVKFHDGAALTADDVAASWNQIVYPAGRRDQRAPRLLRMIDTDRGARREDRGVPPEIRRPTAFLPALADPYAFIYEKAILDRDPHWYAKNIWAPGRSCSQDYQAGQSISGVRNPDYYRPGLPYLDGFTGIFADKQAVRVAAIRADRAAIEFRGFPPATRDELVAGARRQDHRAGKRLELRRPDHPEPRAQTVRRRAGAPRADPGDRPLARRAGLAKITVMRTVGGVVFPGSPLAATKAELEQLAGYWPDIEKSRAEARRLLKEAGAGEPDVRTAQPQRRPALQVQWRLGRRRMEQDRRAGDSARRCRPARGSKRCAPAISTWRSRAGAANSSTRWSMSANTCRIRSDPQNYGNFDDPAEVALYDKMLREPDPRSSAR